MLFNCFPVSAFASNNNTIKNNQDETVQQSVYSTVVNSVYGSTPKKKYLVGYNNETEFNKAISKKKISPFNNKKMNRLKATVLELDEEQLQTLKSDKSVRYIEKNSVVYKASFGEIERTSSQLKQSIQSKSMSPSSSTTQKTEDTEIVPWGLQAIGADLSTKQNINGKNIKVAVLDTGIANHSDLRVSGGVSFVDGITDYTDDNGHGTHVTGTIGALDNSIGVLGIADKTEIYAVKVLDKNGVGDYAQVIQGIQWAIDNKMNIISLSLGGGEESQALHEAIKLAVDQGILVIAAAGNRGAGPDGAETELYPALFPEVVSVGAVTKSFARTFYSSTGTGLDIMAPGDDILSTTNDGEYGVLSGTSMAVPHVTGAAAALWSTNIKLTAEEVKQTLYQSATRLGYDNYYGHGMLNLARALNIIDSPIPPLDTTGNEEEPTSNFDIIKFDHDVSVQSEQLKHLKERAEKAGMDSLAKEINGRYFELYYKNYLQHNLPEDIKPFAQKELYSATELNNHLNLDAASFTKLLDEYKKSVNQYVSKLGSGANSLGNVSVLSYNQYGTNQVVKQGQNVVVGCTIDDPKAVNVQVIDVNGTIVKTDTIPPNTVNINYTWSVGSAQTEGKYKIKFMYPSAPGWDDEFNINVKTGDKTILPGQTATVIRDLDYIKKIEVTVYDSSNDIIKTDVINPSSTRVSYQWATTSTTPTGLYKIHFHYPEVTGWDDDFIVQVAASLNAPGVPLNLAISSVTGTSITLTWNASSSATGYRLSLNGALLSDVPSGTSYTFTNLNAGKTYKLGVKAVNAYGESGFNYIDASTSPAPSIPTSPTGLSATSTESSITANWNQVQGATEYIFKNNGQVIKTISTTSYTITGLNTYESYTIEVAAKNSTGTSSYASVIVKTKPTTLLAGSPVDLNVEQGKTRVFSFTPSTSGRFKLYTGSYGGFGAPSDTILELYSDINLTDLVLSSDDANGTIFSEIQYYMQEGVTYYLKLSGYDGEDIHARIGANFIQTDVTTISLNRPLDVQSDDGEKRIFVFTPAISGTYSVNTSFFGGNTSFDENDTIISMYKDINLSEPVVDGYNDDSSDGSRFSNVEVSLQANTNYFIELSTYGDVGLYTRLSVSAAHTIAFRQMDLKQPLDLTAGAQEKAYLSYTPSVSGNYRFFTSPYENGTILSDTVLSLYADPGLTQLINRNDDAAGKHPYGQVFSKLEMSLVANTIYYIVVENFNAAGALKTRFRVEDGFHATRSTAIPTTWEKIESGNISSLYDVDYYRVNVDEPMNLQLSVTTNAIFLEDKNGNLRFIFIPNSLDVYKVNAPGVYYARVESYNPSQPIINSQSVGTTSIPLEDQDYETTTRKSSTTVPQIDAIKGNEYGTVIWEYSQPHEATIVEIYDSRNVKVYQERIGYKDAGPYTSYSWNGGTEYGNLMLGAQYDEEFDGVAERYYARNGIYNLVIYPDDANRKWKILRKIIVKNNMDNIQLVEPIPETNEYGQLINASNRLSSQKCFNYFMNNVYLTDGYMSENPDVSFISWSKVIYGATGLEKFWATLDAAAVEATIGSSDNPMDIVIGILNTVGMVPVVGEAADGVNTILYLVRKDYANAALSATSMIPVAGEAIVGARGVYKAGLKAFSKIDNLAACINCFTSGTVVKTVDGDKPIQEVQVGDLVLSKNPDTEEVAYKPVYQLLQKQVDTVWEISVGDEVITTTDMHPFWVVGKGWVLTKNLNVGDLLEREDSSTIPITNIASKEESTTVYNLSVEDFHTYYVSNLGIFSHNTSCILPVRYLEKAETLFKATATGSKDSDILGKELLNAKLEPDVTDGIKWEPHHLVPANDGRFPSAAAAKKLLEDDFKIDINSVANGMWLPRKKGSVSLEVLDLDNLEVRIVADHGKVHTKKYNEFVFDKLNAVYKEFGPEGYDVAEDRLRQEGIKALNEIREGLMDKTFIIGIVSEKYQKHLN